jgi:hypothetical protein
MQLDYFIKQQLRRVEALQSYRAYSPLALQHNWFQYMPLSVQPNTQGLQQIHDICFDTSLDSALNMEGMSDWFLSQWCRVVRGA